MEVLSPPRKKRLSGDYWFIHGNDKKNQFIFTFGTARRNIHVNGKSAQDPNYAALFWGYYDGEKIIKFEDSFPLDFPPTEPFVFKKTKAGYLFEYQDTRLRFLESYAPSVDGKILTNHIKNEYLVVKGKLFGKKFNGKSYVQKVEVNTPLKSWDWLRFQGETVGTMFHILKKPTLFFNKKSYKVNITASDGHIKLKSNEVDLEAVPYAHHRVLIRGLTVFKYDEFFVEVKGTIGKKEIHEFGMSEEARGIVF
ncbi:MAG: hypothetical protein GOU98_00650 [Candidatus Altiarchaeota archaeon]|nr:hypothetical protein [Candidatus Altiarchaeota archaeon]